MRPRLALLAAGLLAAFAAWTAVVLHRPPSGLDVTIVRGIQAVNWGPLGATFHLFTLLAGPNQDVLAALLIAVVLVFRRPAVWLQLAGAGEGVLYSILDQILRRPRPTVRLVHVVNYGGGYGYPSGHAAFFLAFGLLTVTCLCWGRVAPWALALAFFAAGLVLADACLSRMYEGQHWPSDILGGLLLGGGWASLVLSVRRLSDPVLGT